MHGSRREIRIFDREYPPALRELPYPPDPIWIEGQLWPCPAVAVVGTRRPSQQAAAYASELGGALARAGVGVWSGGAFGIDAAAHRGALDAGGISVAVIGTGLDHCYPKEHGPLYRRIVESGGALISMFSPDQHATLTTFPQRNAVLAAMTGATVVVQAPFKSGARSTSRWARRLRRPVFVVPVPPWEDLGEGNCAELRLGGIPLTDPGELLRRLTGALFVGGFGEPNAGEREHKRRATATLDLQTAGVPAPDDPMCAPLTDASVRQAVLALASETPRHAEDFCARSGFASGAVHQALLTLTLDAVLVEGPVGWFRSVTIRDS
jgi:DNA processing protein